jgi:chitinase
VNGLTHLNYAFAFIDPSTFKITTMDAATPVHTFTDFAALKAKNPAIELFVSIGGWTFSDNETATQPIFGNIARSGANRQTFANNVLQFLNTYGYDGVDIDWEYPGAPDRGGKPDDTKNYVLMLETLRKTFHNSGRKLGITFTAPSSFWYLRWFDLTAMVKHVDWINIVSHDDRRSSLSTSVANSHSSR